MIAAAVRSVAMVGQPLCGDTGVAIDGDERALIAVVDGLGHGEPAAEASRRAATVLREHVREPVDELVLRCHRELRGTRGVVMAIASFAGRAMTWVGIGNIEGIVVRGGADVPDTSLASRGGIVGFRIPPLIPRVVEMSTGDVVVLASDGVPAGFRYRVRGVAVEDIADVVLARATGADDACVVAARFAGATR